MADEIAAAAGRPVMYLPVSSGQFLSALLADGLPADDARELTDLFADVLDGRNAHLNDGVRQALGRPPRDFADFARSAAATGVWSLEPSRVA